MKRSPTALLLLAVWIAGIVAAGVVCATPSRSQARIFACSSRHRRRAEQRLVMEGIGEGPAARVLVIALEGAPAERLADASRAVVDALRDDDSFVLVANGDVAADAFPEALLPYRYLLSSTLDTRRFDADFLAAALAARAQDLASPAGVFLEPLLPRDPTLELMNVLERWGSARAAAARARRVVRRGRRPRAPDSRDTCARPSIQPVSVLRSRSSKRPSRRLATRTCG